MPVRVIYGQTPFIIVLPYCGVSIPRTVYARLTEEGRAMEDADGYLDRVTDNLLEDATLVRANFHRCVSDPEMPKARALQALPPDNEALGIVPLKDRSGRDLWEERPSVAEAARWRSAFYAPFHAAVNAQIARVRAAHGRCVIATFHTIRATDPFADFDMVLSVNQTSSKSVLMSAVLSNLLRAEPQYKTHVNGHASARFITQQHGRPELSILALQISIKPECYLTTEGEIGLFDPVKSAPLRGLLKDVFGQLDRFEAA